MDKVWTDPYLISQTIQQYKENEGFDEGKLPKTSREFSWLFCYQEFQNLLQNKEKDEYLSLCLANYLASWGMYRNSFLMECSHLIHKEAIEVLRKHAALMEYAKRDFKTPAFRQELSAAYVDLEKRYNELKEKGVSQTLITKILLGVYGCVPAYDENARRAFRAISKKEQTFKIQQSGTPDKLFGSLFDCLEINEHFCDAIEKEREKLPSDYTFMKTVDMFFFQYGKDLLEKDKKKKANKAGETK